MIRLVLYLAILLTGTASASATPITYIHTGFGSGSIGSVTFGNTAPIAFTITAQADTTNVQFNPMFPGYFNNNISTQIDIAGIGAFSFITQTRYWSSFNLALGIRAMGFGYAGPSGADLFGAPNPGASVPPWDTTTSIGPLSGFTSLLQWSNQGSVMTSGGRLIFNDAVSVPSTFQAILGSPTLVPEPRTSLLFGACLAGLFLSRRLSRQRTDRHSVRR